MVSSEREESNQWLFAGAGKPIESYRKGKGGFMTIPAAALYQAQYRIRSCPCFAHVTKLANDINYLEAKKRLKV